MFNYEMQLMLSSTKLPGKILENIFRQTAGVFNFSFHHAQTCEKFLNEMRKDSDKKPKPKLSNEDGNR